MTKKIFLIHLIILLTFWLFCTYMYFLKAENNLIYSLIIYIITIISWFQFILVAPSKLTKKVSFIKFFNKWTFSLWISIGASLEILRDSDTGIFYSLIFALLMTLLAYITVTIMKFSLNKMGL